MKTSEIFQRIEDSDLSKPELEIMELLEESFTDITQVNQSDYVSVEEYFNSIKRIFPNKEIVTSNDLKNHIKSKVLNYKNEDLLFLDGLDSLANCLIKYGGNDDLQSFESWFYDRLRKIKGVFLY